MIAQFADTTKQFGVADTLEGRDGIQRDLDRLERWAHVNLLIFNKVECPTHGSGQTQAQIQAERWIESSPEEKYLGGFVEEKLNMTQQGILTALKADRILGSIKSSMASVTRDVALICSHETLPGILLPPVGPQHRESVDLLEHIQRKAMNEIRGLEHLCCSNWSREGSGETALGHFSKRGLTEKMERLFT